MFLFLMQQQIAIADHSSGVIDKYGIAVLTITSVVTAVAGVWKYITSQNENAQKFFVEEKNKLELQLKEDSVKIQELQNRILSIREEHIVKLEDANRRLRESNNLLSQVKRNENI